MGETEEGASAVYHVFINHRGTDTKKSVASLIYRRLIKYGLRVFLDQDELEAGNHLYDKIKNAISSSSVHVAIFSVRYAQSSWCLNELSDMLQSGCKIIPIFYDIKPVELRYIENGRYAEAFRIHQNKRRVDIKLVERWKDALRQASNISGMEFNAEEDDLGVLVEEIVEEVLKEAKWELLHVAEHPVGLHEAAEHFNNFLKERHLSDTTVVGIMGLDGSGKSTLVRHLYNCYLQSRKFKRYCFLSELNENDLAVLQQKLVRDLIGDDKTSISDTTKGKRTLQTCLKGCGPVLIVLDGLEKEEQIECLLLVVKKDVLAEGSLILVTCHDKALLKSHHVNLFYDVKLLQGKDGHELFCLYAFDQPKPPQHLEDLVEKFVELCNGFPLALKVLGRKLYVKQDRRYWEEQLKELSRPKIPINIISKILKVSYDNLEEEKKEAFLDVAHFLVGEDTDLAVRVLDGLHGSGLICLEELQSKCLLDLEEIEHCKRPFAKGPGIQWRIKGSSKIRMHDLVRKMARQIANEDSRASPEVKPLRLCLDDKSILQQLQSRRSHVRGIRSECVDEPEREDQDIKEPQLPLPNMDKPEMTDEEIYGLRLLVLHDFRVPFPSNRLSGDLIWLRMHKSNWGNTIASTLSLQKLTVLELHGVNFGALGRVDGDKFPSKLGELTVDNCEEPAEIPRRNRVSRSVVDKASFPPSDTVWDCWFIFRQLTDLVKLVLKNFKGLRSLPIDFEALRNLRHLDLSGWSDLDKMPHSFAGLRQLQYLALQDCMSLSISNLGEITKLEYLDFEGCSLLRTMPDKTTAQCELRYLNLLRTSIQQLPQDLGNLKKLEQLLVASSYLRTLPRSFHELGQLRILTLSGCLHILDISSSISIENFPYLESIHVKALFVSEFRFERDQSKMPLDRFHSQESTDDGNRSVGATDHNRVSCLKDLRLVETGISKLWIPREESIFPDFEIVDLSGNPRLREVQSLPCTLRRLYLKNCPVLTTLPHLSNLVCLRILDISGCHSLVTLDISGCHNLEALDISGCRSLEVLDISWCRNLKAVNLEGLTFLEEIEAKYCLKLQSIQGLAQLLRLTHLCFLTFNEVPNSLWSEVQGFTPNVSTVILGGAKVLCMNAEEMDSLKQSILKEFEGATIVDIPTFQKVYQVRRNVELYGALLLCFMAKKYFVDFKVRVDDNVYDICCPCPIETFYIHREHEETYRAYIFMWSQNYNLLRDLSFLNKSVVDCTIEGRSATLEESFTKAWIVMIRNRTDGVKICKQLLNSFCCIPKQAVHQAVAL